MRRILVFSILFVVLRRIWELQVFQDIWSEFVWFQEGNIKERREGGEVEICWDVGQTEAGFDMVGEHYGAQTVQRVEEQEAGQVEEDSAAAL